MNFKKIVVLMGGPSSEAEISRLTGTAILNALQEKGYNAVGMEFVPKTLVEDIKKSGCDIVFNAVHGKYGEDGRIAAVLEMISYRCQSGRLDRQLERHLLREVSGRRFDIPCFFKKGRRRERSLPEFEAQSRSLPSSYREGGYPDEKEQIAVSGDSAGLSVSDRAAGGHYGGLLQRYQLFEISGRGLHAPVVSAGVYDERFCQGCQAESVHRAGRHGDCVAAGSAGGLRAESVQFQGQGRDQDGVLVPGADSVHRARFHHAALCGQPV